MPARSYTQLWLPVKRPMGRQSLAVCGANCGGSTTGWPPSACVCASIFPHTHTLRVPPIVPPGAASAFSWRSRVSLECRPPPSYVSLPYLQAVSGNYTSVQGSPLVSVTVGVGAPIVQAQYGCHALWSRFSIPIVDQL